MESDFSFNQQYTLRWNDFHKKLINSFQSLHESDDFVDVTIACEGKSFSAHKIVLSSCSQYFRRLLKANPCPHPIIILQTISHKLFEYLIDFMYNGVVHIEPDNLFDFLQAANDLKIQGLTDVQYPKNVSSNKAHSVISGSSTRVDEQFCDENEKNETCQQLTNSEVRKSIENELSSIDNMIDMTYQSSTSSERVAQPKREPIDELIIDDDDTYEHETSNNLLQTKKPPDPLNQTQNSSFSLQYPNNQQQQNVFSNTIGMNNETQNYDIAELINRTRMQDPNNPEANLCVICNRNYSNPSNLRAHILNIHSDKSKNLWYECNVCKKKLKTKHYYINHLLHKHGIRQRDKMKDVNEQTF